MSDNIKVIEIEAYEDFRERVRVVSVNNSYHPDELLDEILEALLPDHGCRVCEHCNREDRTTSSKEDPYTAERHGRSVYSMMCDNCQHQSYMDR